MGIKHVYFGIVKAYGFVYNLLFTGALMWVMSLCMRMLIASLILVIGISSLEDMNPYVVGTVLGLWALKPVFSKVLYYLRYFENKIRKVEVREEIDILFDLEERVEKIEKAIEVITIYNKGDKECNEK